MSEPDPSSGSDLLQWLAIAATSIGIALQHWWSKKQLVNHREQDQFDKYIAEPAKHIISKIDVFAATASLIRVGEEPDHTQKFNHAVLVKSINSFTRDCVDSKVGGGNDWYEVSTREIENGVPSTPGQVMTAMQQKTLIAALDRQTNKIQKIVKLKRPN